DEVLRRPTPRHVSAQDALEPLVDDDVALAPARLRSSILTEHAAPADADPPVPQVDVTPAEGDRFRRPRARPEAKVDERVVLAAFTGEPIEDPLSLLIRVGIDVGSVRTPVEPCHEATVE